MPDKRYRLDDEELLNDPRLRMLVEATDPARTVIVPPPRLSAAELREWAQTQRHIGDPPWLRMLHWCGYHLRRTRRWGVPAMAAVLTSLAVIAFRPAIIPTFGGRPTTPSEPSLPAPLALPDPEHAPAARDQLLALIEQAVAMPYLAPDGPVTFVHTRTWSRDTTSSTVDVATAFDEQLWWAADQSGRRLRTPLPAGVGPAAGVGGSPRVEDYRAGELVLPVDQPSSDPVILAGQLSGHQPFDQGPQAVIRAVADMYRYHLLTPAQRAAALRVLADTDGLRSGGTVTDRAGRTGTAISVDSDNGATRDVAVFDPGSGVLLSYERVALISPPRSAVRAPALIASVLYLAHSRTDHIG